MGWFVVFLNRNATVTLPPALAWDGFTEKVTSFSPWGEVGCAHALCTPHKAIKKTTEKVTNNFRFIAQSPLLYFYHIS